MRESLSTEHRAPDHRPSGGAASEHRDAAAHAIRLEQVAFEISQEGLEAMLARQGVEVKLSSLSMHVSADALVLLLRRLMPASELQARVTPAGVVIERMAESGPVRIELAVPQLRVRAQEGRLEAQSEHP